MTVLVIVIVVVVLTSSTAIAAFGRLRELRQCRRDLTASAGLSPGLAEELLAIQVCCKQLALIGSRCRVN